MQIGLVVWLCTNYTDSVCQKQVLILNACVAVMQGFAKTVSAMHLGLDVRALTHGWLYMLKIESQF